MTQSSDIIEALAARHAQDLFAAEVNCGPAHSLRLDAWAAPRSWASWETHGYEIKVSRGDWFQDKKIEQYRQYVHRMWVVCPHGLIQPNEVSGGLGLIWVSKTGTRCYAKVKASLGEAPLWTEAVQSLLINRAVLSRKDLSRQGPDIRREVCRDFLAGKIEDEQLGWKMRQGVAVKLKQLAGELQDARRLARELEWLESKARANGWRCAHDAVEKNADGKSFGVRELSGLRLSVKRLVDDINKMLPAEKEGKP